MSFLDNAGLSRLWGKVMARRRALTASEYDALSDTEKNADVVYMVPETGGSSGSLTQELVILDSGTSIFGSWSIVLPGNLTSHAAVFVRIECSESFSVSTTNENGYPINAYPPCITLMSWPLCEIYQSGRFQPLCFTVANNGSYEYDPYPLITNDSTLLINTNGVNDPDVTIDYTVYALG